MPRFKLRNKIVNFFQEGGAQRMTTQKKVGLKAKLIRSLCLEPIAETSEPESNNSEAYFTASDDEDLTEMIKSEVESCAKRIIKHWMQNVLLIWLQIVECCWMIGITLLGHTLRWNLWLCEQALFITTSVLFMCCCVRVKTGEHRTTINQTNNFTRNEDELKVEIGENKTSELLDQDQPPESGSPTIRDDKLLVILDLDQTLIHSTSQPPFQNDQVKSLQDLDSSLQHFIVPDQIRNEKLHVYLRPYLHEFLQQLFKMQDHVTVAVYTGGTQEYCEAVLSHIDPGRNIKHRYCRQNCLFDQHNKVLLKDLTIVTELVRKSKSLRRVVMLDDSPITFNRFSRNVIKVKAWRNDNKRDNILKDCLAILRQMRFSSDVRVDLPQFLELYRNLKEES